MINALRSEKMINTELELPLDAQTFSGVVSQIEEIETDIRKVKSSCEQKLRRLRERKKQLQNELLQRKKLQNVDVLEVKLFEERKKQLWRNGKLLSESPLSNQDLQVSLFDYLG